MMEVRLQVLTALLTKIYLFWDVEVVRTTLRNVGNHLPVDTTLCLRKIWILKMNLLEFGRKYYRNFCGIFCYRKGIFCTTFFNKWIDATTNALGTSNFRLFVKKKFWLSEYSCHKSSPNVEIFWACSFYIPYKFISVLSNKTSLVKFRRSLFGLIVDLVIYVCMFS